MNGDREGPLNVDDAPEGLLDMEMLDNAAEDVLRDNNIPEPMNDAPPRALPVNELREVYTTPYGGNAGAPIDDVKRPTQFERLANTYPLDDTAGEFGPFKSEKEWDFAEWCAKTLGHGEMDRMLDLDYVSAHSRTTVPIRLTFMARSKKPNRPSTTRANSTRR